MIVGGGGRQENPVGAEDEEAQAILEKTNLSQNGYGVRSYDVMIIINEGEHGLHHLMM